MSGRGSISKSRKGTWSFVVDIPAAGSKRRQVRRRGFATRRQAQEALNELVSSLQSGTFVSPVPLTLGEYLGNWVDNLAVTGRGRATISSYRHNLRLHVIAYIGELRLQDVSASDLDRLYRRLLTDGPKERDRWAVQPDSAVCPHNSRRCTQRCGQQGVDREESRRAGLSTIGEVGETS